MDATARLGMAEDLEALEKELIGCHASKSTLDTEIASLLERNSELPKQLNMVLNRVKTQLAMVESDASQLSSMLSLTSVLAENISGKVRELDIAKSRVVDCLQRVEDITDLKFCTEGVQAAMQNEDYEQAAGLIHRFLALDESFMTTALDSAAAGQQSNGQPSGNDQQQPPAGQSSLTLAQSCEILRRADQELCGIVTEKFDEAMANKDVASMERFFKLFPLLNQHDVGLQKFSGYLRDKVKETADVNYAVMQSGGQDDSRTNVLYADTLTLLFEGIARVVEIHQPLIETYYGPDRLFTVLQILQKECDSQAERIITKFVDHRKFKSLARSTRYQPAAPAPAGSGASSGSGGASGAGAGQDRLDPMVLDTVLAEVTLMNTRAELYLRFVNRRLVHGLESINDEKVKSIKEEEIKSFLKNCGLRCRMEELIGQYIAMEEYFMRECVAKALGLVATGKDFVLNPGDKQLTSPLVEDVFFVVRKCVRRSLSSSSVDCVCAMLNYASSILETEYYQALQSRLKAGYPSVGSFAEAAASATAAYTAVMQQGKIPGSGVEGAEKARVEFLIALNDSEASVDAIMALKESLGRDIEKHLGGTVQPPVSADGVKFKTPVNSGKQKVESCLSSFVDISNVFSNSVKHGIEQLVRSAVKPRLKTWVELYLDTTHAPSEAEFADFEVNDPFISQLMANLDGLLVSFKDSLTDNNYNSFVEETCSELSRRLEGVIQRVTFNRLGGLQLDKEVRELVGYLTAVTSWKVRERFTRLSQIAMLLNVETVAEVKDLWAGGVITWRLTPGEMRLFLSLRMDLPGDELRRLKL